MSYTSSAREVPSQHQNRYLKTSCKLSRLIACLIAHIGGNWQSQGGRSVRVWTLTCRLREYNSKVFRGADVGEMINSSKPYRS
jgi:hypothetical protein